MDPLVDKIMIAAAFISLVPLKAIPAWAATSVVARDFLITGLRLMAATKGLVLPAERLGKHKTSWQIVTVVFFLLLLALQELRFSGDGAGWWLRAWNAFPGPTRARPRKAEPVNSAGANSCRRHSFSTMLTPGRGDRSGGHSPRT
jgi:phosphatidylglycerophosphate synthase